MECLLLSMALAEGAGTCRLPSERQIAAQTGVSLITVKRALGELAAKGLVERRHGSGNYPIRKPSLQDLIDGVQPRRLAVYSDETFHSSTLLRYDLMFFIQQRLAGGGTDLLVLNEGAAPMELKRRAIEGVFVCGRKFPPELQASDWMPRVQVTATRSLEYVDTIRMDLEDAGRQAAGAILRSGRKEICLLGADGPEKKVSQKLFAETRRHLPTILNVHETFGNVGEIYATARKWLSLTRRTPGFVVSGFYLCSGALIRAAEAESRSIGGDVLLLAFGTNNVVFEDLVPISVLRVNRQEMADCALEQMLLRIMAPRLPARAVRLPFRLG